jgi:hypothetical protein
MALHRYSHRSWLVAPFITSIPKETLAFTLEATRKAVRSKLNVDLGVAPTH